MVHSEGMADMVMDDDIEADEFVNDFVDQVKGPSVEQVVNIVSSLMWRCL